MKSQLPFALTEVDDRRAKRSDARMTVEDSRRWLRLSSSAASRVGALAFAAGLGVALVAGSPAAVAAPDSSTASASAEPSSPADATSDDDKGDPDKDDRAKGDPAEDDSAESDPAEDVALTPIADVDDGVVEDVESDDTALDDDATETEDTGVTRSRRATAEKSDEDPAAELVADSEAPDDAATSDLDLRQSAFTTLAPDDADPENTTADFDDDNVVTALISRLTAVADTTEQPTGPVRTVTAAVAATTQIFATAFGPLFGQGDAPSAPAPTGLWAMLAYVRKEFEHTFFAAKPEFESYSVTVESQPGVAGQQVALLGQQPDGRALTYSVDGSTTAVGSAGGTLTVAGPAEGGTAPTQTFVYTPKPGWDGVTPYTDTFTVTASDAGSGFHVHGVSGLVNALTFGLVGDSGHEATATVTVQVVPVSAPTAVAENAVQELCGQWDKSVGSGGYIIANNAWGLSGGSTSQCISTSGGNGFQMTKELQETWNLKGYPSIYLGCHYSTCSTGFTLANAKQVKNILSAPTQSTFTLVPGYSEGGNQNQWVGYNASYDIWLDATNNNTGEQNVEVMVWNHITPYGNIVPRGQKKATGITLAGVPGATFDVWVDKPNKSQGLKGVVTYVATTPIPNDSFDAMLFVNNAIGYGTALNENYYLTSIQAGFEIWNRPIAPRTGTQSVPPGTSSLTLDNFSAVINPKP